VNPKVYLLAESGEGLRMRIKVEVNTRERSPADPVPLLPLRGAVSLVGRAGAIPRDKAIDVDREEPVPPSTD